MSALSLEHEEMKKVKQELENQLLEAKNNLENKIKELHSEKKSFQEKQVKIFFLFLFSSITAPCCV